MIALRTEACSDSIWEKSALLQSWALPGCEQRASGFLAPRGCSPYNEAFGKLLVPSEARFSGCDWDDAGRTWKENLVVVVLSVELLVVVTFVPASKTGRRNLPEGPGI